MKRHREAPFMTRDGAIGETRHAAGTAPPASSRYGRLRRNLAASFAVIGLVLAAIAGWSIVKDYQRRMQEAEQQTRVLARALDGQVDAVLGGVAVTLRDAAKRIGDGGGAQGMDRARLHQLLKAQSDLMESKPVMFVLAADGEVRADSVNPVSNYPNQANRECLVRLRRQPEMPLCIARPIKSPISEKWRIVVAMPLPARGGRYDGTVGLCLDPDFFKGFYQSLGLGEDYSLLLARTDGIVLSRYPWLESFPGRDVSKSPVFVDGVTQSDAGTILVDSQFDARKRLVSYQRNARFPLVVTASVTRDAILAAWQTDTVAKTAFGLLALLGITGLFAVTMRQVRRLEESETDLLQSKFSIDHSSEIVLWIGLDGRIRYANEAACLRCGYGRDEMHGLEIFDLCPGLERERWQSAMQVMRRQRSRRLMEIFRTKAGQVFQLDVVASLVEFAGGAVICANARDVSAQRAAEAALGESESRYRSTVDSLHEGVLVRDHHSILACNPSAERIFGLPAERIIGRAALTPLVTFYNEQGVALNPGEGPAFIALKSGKPQHAISYRLRRADGSSLWLEANATPLFRGGVTIPYRVVTTYTDITQRRESDSALRASEEKFAKVFDVIPEIVTVTDHASGRYVDMNQAFPPAAGYRREEAIGRTAMELNIWVDIDDRLRLLDDIQSRGAVRDREIWFRRKDGSQFMGRCSGCVFEVQGRKLLLMIVRDVTRENQADTARRAAEESLRTSEERFEIAVRNAEVGIWDWRIVEDRMDVSDVYARLMEIAPGTPPQSPAELAARVHADDRERVLLSIRRALLKRGALDMEYRVPLAAGGVRWLRAQGRATYGDNGRAVRFTGSVQDITERKRVEEALAESEAKFREIFASSLDPIWIARVRSNGRIEYEDWNRTQAAAIGMRVQDVVGKTPRELFPPWAADIIETRWRECVAGGVPMTWEETWPLPAGKRVWISSVVPIRDADGNIFRLAGVARDITERIAASENIRKLNEDLELRVAERTRELRMANQEMEAFSYSVSHDLRAPLRAIEGFSALLAQVPRPGEERKAQDYLGRIRAAALRMGRLIDDMLNLSRVGRHQLNIEEFDLAPLARDVFEEIRAAEPSREVTFATMGDLRVKGDLSLLRIVLTNLIGNAWKFTGPVKQARIDVRGEHVAGAASISVLDNGVGFDPAYSARLFGAFQRLHTEKEFAGSGIGLAIVQRIVQRHGGEIFASSLPGAGASFTIRLPLAVTAAAARA